MTKPADFTPANAIEVKESEDARAVSRRVWVVRIAGLVVTVLGWLAVSLPHWGQTTVGVNALVFAGLTAFAFAAAELSRKQFVHLEKKLRLRLLVHNMELENMAMRDELTQLFNRRYLFDRLERELATARGFQRPLAVILIDMDALGETNDKYGFEAGDKVLANFGRYLLDHTRATDIPARIGSDEFAVILPDTSKRGASTMVDRLLKGLDKEPLVEEQGLTLRVSAALGMSGYPWGGETVDAIVQDAAAAARSEKQARREMHGPGDNGNAGQPPAVPAMFRKPEHSAEEPPDAELVES
ncbi:MAG TPA: GGDEF domain-containing protein [Dehalococcoidia bacterium]|nr:GGDEF domain-containing protein [Dehalococcoidia bacterium]